MKAQLIKKIERREFIVGIIGLGYVGRPIMLNFIENGFSVKGFDIDTEKILILEEGQSYIKHIPSKRVREAWATDRLELTTSYSKLMECDGIIIAVPTPLTINREPDMTYLTLLIYYFFEKSSKFKLNYINKLR